MKQLLDFMGALLFAFVIPIISPVLLLVYCFTGLLMAMSAIRRWQFRMPVTVTRFKTAWLHFFNVKRYLLFSKG